MTEPRPGISPWVRVLANLALLLVALCAFAALGEVVTRVFGGIRYGGWGDPASIRLVTKQYAANSRGLRDRELPNTAEPGEFRILCLGDSFTWGQMVAFDEAFPKVLERKLASRAGAGKTCTVINAGQLGWNTESEARWFAKEGRRYAPQVVLLGYFLNDPEIGHYEIARLLPARAERALKDSYFYFFLKYRVHLLRVRFGLARSYESYLESLYAPDAAGWSRCRRALGSIRDTAAALDARVLVLVFPLITPWESYRFERLHEEVAAACSALGMPSADLLDDFRASPHPWSSLRVGPNDEHPSALGQRIIADAALAALDANGLLPPGY